jgi:hypothetical protein
MAWSPNFDPKSADGCLDARVLETINLDPISSKPATVDVRFCKHAGRRLLRVAARRRPSCRPELSRVRRGLQFSPVDERLVGYASDRTGQLEVYVALRSDLSAGRPVSDGRGTQMRWSRTGRELFYRHFNEIHVVGVSVEGGTVQVGRDTIFSEGRYLFGGARRSPTTTSTSTAGGFSW